MDLQYYCHCLDQRLDIFLDSSQKGPHYWHQKEVLHTSLQHYLPMGHFQKGLQSFLRKLNLLDDHWQMVLQY